MKAVVYHEFGGRDLAGDGSRAIAGSGWSRHSSGSDRAVPQRLAWLARPRPRYPQFPHVPGHEFAGVVVAVGRDVRQTFVGQRVTMPFVAGCGACPECQRGNRAYLRSQFQPGFTGWGSFAEYVAVRYADGNLVPLPESMSSSTAAALGCRLATAYRAVRAKDRYAKDNGWLSTAAAASVFPQSWLLTRAARVIAVDVRAEPLALAKQLGADFLLNSRDTPDIPSAIHEITGRGADVSIDALGSAATLVNSILSLRKRGRHVQIGLLTGRDQIPLALVSRLIAWELEMIGSHGLQAHAYPGLFELIERGKLDPAQLVERELPLDQAPHALASLDEYRGCGVTVFTPQR